MTCLEYDGSFQGLLTVIFEVYERKLDGVKIFRAGVEQVDIFARQMTVYTHAEKAHRVWTGLSKKLSISAMQAFVQCFLSETQGIDDTLLAYARHVFLHQQNIETDYGCPEVLKISQTARKVYREKHRMEAFVRFQRATDDVYYASIAPDYNVLPLIAPHFINRYPDQHWMIFDSARQYGLFYNKTTFQVEEIYSEDVPGNLLSTEQCHAEETRYATLWRTYFKTVNISARNNKKLHMRHMPYRYWKYLTEKKNIMHL